MNVHTKGKLTSLTTAAFAAVVALTMASGSAHALCFSQDNTGGATSDWTNKHYAVLTLGDGQPTQVSITGPSSVSAGPGIIGVGIANAGSLQINGPSFIKAGSSGKPTPSTAAVILDTNFGDTFKLDHPATIGPGGVEQDTAGDNFVENAADEVDGTHHGPNVITRYSNLTANVFVPGDQISGPMTIEGTNANCNVLDVSKVQLDGGAVVTLHSSSPTASFTINDSGKFAMTGGSKFILSGTLTAGDVLFNIENQGEDVSLNGGTSACAGNGCRQPNAQITGILLSPQRNIQLSPGQVNGEVIAGGKQLTIVSGSQVINKP